MKTSKLKFLVIAYAMMTLPFLVMMTTEQTSGITYWTQFTFQSDDIDWSSNYAGDGYLNTGEWYVFIAVSTDSCGNPAATTSSFELIQQDIDPPELIIVSGPSSKFITTDCISNPIKFDILFAEKDGGNWDEQILIDNQLIDNDNSWDYNGYMITPVDGHACNCDWRINIKAQIKLSGGM